MRVHGPNSTTKRSCVLGTANCCRDYAAFGGREGGGVGVSNLK